MLDDAQRRNIEIVLLAVGSIIEGMSPTNARTISAALRETGPIWARWFRNADKKVMRSLLARASAEGHDTETSDNMTAFAALLAPAE